MKFAFFCVASFLLAASNVAIGQTISVETYQTADTFGTIITFTHLHGTLSADGSFIAQGAPLLEGYSSNSDDASEAEKLVGKFVAQERNFGPRQADAFSRGKSFTLPGTIAQRFEVQIATCPIPAANPSGGNEWDNKYSKAELASVLKLFSEDLAQVNRTQGDNSATAIEYRNAVSEIRRARPISDAAAADRDADDFDKDLDALADKKLADMDQQHAAQQKRIQALLDNADAEVKKQRQLNADAIARARQLQARAAQVLATQLLSNAKQAMAADSTSPNTSTNGTSSGDGFYDIQVMKSYVDRTGEMVTIDGAVYHIIRHLTKAVADDLIATANSYTADKEFTNGIDLKENNKIIRGPYQDGPAASAAPKVNPANGSSATPAATPQATPAGASQNTVQSDPAAASGGATGQSASAQSNKPAQDDVIPPTPPAVGGLNKYTKEQIVEALAQLDQQIDQIEKSLSDGTAIGDPERKALNQLKEMRLALQEQATSGKNPAPSASDLPPEQKDLPVWYWKGWDNGVQLYELSGSLSADHGSVAFIPNFPVDRSKIPVGWSVDPDTGAIFSSKPTPYEVAARAWGPAWGGKPATPMPEGLTPTTPYGQFLQFKSEYKP